MAGGRGGAAGGADGGGFGARTKTHRTKAQRTNAHQSSVCMCHTEQFYWCKPELRVHVLNLRIS